MSKRSEELANLIDRFIKEVNPRSLLIITHVNADPDALASVLLLLNYFTERFNVKVHPFFPEGPSRLSKKILQTLIPDFKIPTEPPELFDSVVVLDTPSSTQLGNMRDRVLKLLDKGLLIDHHKTKADLTREMRYVHIDNSLACTVPIAELVLTGTGEIPGSLATIALTGILYDTGKFSRADSRTLRIVATLIENGGDYSKALALLKEEPDLSERVACLKAASRALIVRVGEFVIVGSWVSSQEAAAARALIRLGADVVVIAGGKRGDLRLSFRSTPKFYRETGISLGRDVISLLEDILEGEGGGHHTSAGFNGRGDPQKALQVALRLIVSEVSRRVVLASRAT